MFGLSLAGILAFFNAVDPNHALLGAVVLFVTQLVLGDKLPNVSGAIKLLVSKMTNVTVPAAPAAAPAPGETGVLGGILHDMIQKRLVASGDAGAELVKIVDAIRSK